MKFILLLLISLITFATAANQTSQALLLKIELQQSKLELTGLVTNMNKVEQQLAKLTTVEEKTMAQSTLLKLLSQLAPNDEQRAWVTKLTNSAATLHIANQDHPEQLLEIINIARQAKNTQFSWQVNQKANIISSKWLRQDWHWQPLLSAPSEVEYQAIDKATAKVDGLTINWLQQQLISQGLASASNRLLVLLIKHKSNTKLLTQLWRNPSDEYSYQLLQQLNTLFPAEQVITQLMQASNNKELLSQSLMLLAKNFQHHDKAQQFLIKKLQQADSAWHAATALSQTSNHYLQKTLTTLAISSDSKAVKFAAQHISSTQIKE